MEVVANALRRVALENGLNPQSLQQGVLLNGLPGMENSAEAARIAESQHHPIAKEQVNMVMPLHRGLPVNHPECSTHSQVDNDCPPIGLQQQIFCPAPDVADHGALYPATDILGDRPAQGVLSDNNLDDGLTTGGGLYSSACGLNLWEFRHNRRSNLLLWLWCTCNRSNRFRTVQEQGRKCEFTRVNGHFLTQLLGCTKVR